MSAQHESIYKLLVRKLDYKNQYLSSLDEKSLENYRKVNKQLYGHTSFEEIPQRTLDLIALRAAEYTDGFSEVILKSLASNIRFSSF